MRMPRRPQNTLQAPLNAILGTEANRAISMVDALRESFKMLSPHPTTAWLEGVNSDERGGEDRSSRGVAELTARSAWRAEIATFGRGY